MIKTPLYFLFLLLIAITTNAQTVNGIATYEVMIGDDPRALQREIDRQRLREAQRLSNEITFNLYFTEKESYFEIAEKPVNHNYFSPLFVEMATHHRGYDFYVDISSSTYIYTLYNSYLNKEYTIKDHFDYQWEILDETTQIDNLVAYKAIGYNKFDKQIEAWFTPEIPSSAGPQNFYGLPGLIIQLQVGYTKYVLKNVNLQQNISHKIIKIDDTNALTESEYREESKKAFE